MSLMFYKQVLVIREKPAALKTQEARGETVTLKECCRSKGTSTVKTVFDKNQFLPNEVARGSVCVDNEHSQLNIKEVCFYFMQICTIKCGGHRHTIAKPLIEKSVEGPKAGVANWTHEMTIELDKIAYQVTKEKKKKGSFKAVSPEDQFMMAGLQAATTSDMICNLYFLKLEFYYDAGECCAEKFY